MGERPTRRRAQPPGLAAVTRYVLNTAVISNPGMYVYRLITHDEAREWLSRGPVVSRVGYPATADFIRRALGVRLDLSREPTDMHTGDTALVVRLKYRLADPRPKATDSGWGDDDFELGLLTCLAL